MAKFVYPEVRRDEEFVETKFGKDVRDPYRWLEDVDSAETADFVEKQNAITVPYLQSCPYRENIKERLKNVFEYVRYGTPYRRGSNYFVEINTGLQNQYVMNIARGSIDAKLEVFLDPNKLSEDGTISLGNIKAFSHDGKWFAYGVVKSGSDWNTIHVRNVDTGEDLPDKLTKVKFTSLSFTADNKGFFYASYSDVPDDFEGKETAELFNQKVYYHRLGTEQSEDVLVYERPDQPKWRFYPEITVDGAYLHLFSLVSCEGSAWFFHRFEDPSNPNIQGQLKFETMVDKFDDDYELYANIGPVHYLRTNNNAPNYRMVAIDLSSAETRSEANWKVILPEHSINVFQSCGVTRDNLLITEHMIDVTSKLQLHRLETGEVIRELPLPIGTLASLSTSRRHNDVFYKYTSFTSPGVVYQITFDSEEDVASLQPKVYHESKPNGFEPSNFVTKQIFYSSKDGTKIPMFIMHHKDVVPDGNTPCMLYGYGGFNISLQPFFSPGLLVWLEGIRGVLAVPNIRGGGEYGKKWHHAGRLLVKQNCFDDFVAAGEYLIGEGYTSQAKLIIRGGSNGGLLVAACTLQRPDLFAGAIAQVGVMDLLRYHKFTIGKAWASDYGDPDEEQHFHNLLKFSPVHNVPDGATVERIPAYLLTTADHDDRVVPLHSFKLIAELQHKLGAAHPDTPVLIRIETKAGHGAGKPTEKIIEETADMYSFAINALSLPYY